MSHKDDQEPTSDHPMSTGRTKALEVASMTAKSIEMLGDEAKASCRDARTGRRLRNAPLASATALATSGA